MNKEIKIGSVWQSNCYSYKAEVISTTEKSVIYFNNSQLKEFLWSKEGFLECFTEIKQKKLVELKCHIDGTEFFSDTDKTRGKEIPYTIKDGKIFIEVDHE